MKKKSSQSTFLEKLKTSSLFQTYRGAFEIATGYRLMLWETVPFMEPGDLKVSVPVGHTFPLELQARPFAGDKHGGRIGESCVRGFLVAFARQLGEQSNRAMLESSRDHSGAVVRAKSFIHSHIGNKIHLGDVAAAAGTCTFQLCRIFKKHTGITMTEYISRKRVQSAKDLLRDPYCQIAGVADQVGFTSLSQFGRNFLRFAGESPTEFRQRLKEMEHCDLAAA